MAGQSPTPKRIVVAAHLNISGGVAAAEAISRFLIEQGAQHGVEKTAAGTLQDPAIVKQLQDGEFDLLVALGGDGTMLRAGSLCAPLGIPVLGINMGHFGFLTEIQHGDWREKIPNLLEGRFWLEDRMMLYAEHIRNGRVMAGWHVINEVVVCRGQFVRPIQILTEIDGRSLYTYVADGLIASTPTGSTAYALAAGGPILPPDLRNILIIPVAPHLSMDRAIVLSEGAGVTMTVHTNHEAVMSVDGRPPEPMLDGDQVRVVSNNFTLHFVRFQDQGYFYRNITDYMEQSPLSGNRL